MSNDMKIKRNLLVQEAIVENPCIIVAKKFIFKVCVLFIVARIVFSIVETLYVINQGFPIISCVLNYCLIGFGILFVIGIYQGGKGFAYLTMVGGILTILNLLKNNFLGIYKWVILFIMFMLQQ